MAARRRRRAADRPDARRRREITLGKMQHEVQSLHNKVIQAAKRRDETLRRQFQRAQALTSRTATRRNVRSASCGSSTATGRPWWIG